MRGIKLKECYSRKSNMAIPLQSCSTAKQSLKVGDITKSHEKKKKRRRSLEGQHQKAAFSWLSLQYPEVRRVTFHPANGGSRNVVEAKSLKAQGVTAGVPDMVCLYPSRSYHGFICEFKHGNNGLTSTQSEFIHCLANLDFYCCVCYTWFEFMEHFLYYIGKRDIAPSNQ